MIETIKRIIQTALPDAEIHVSDPMRDGQHFQSIVISASFESMPLVKQHQKVLNALKEAMHTTVHAMGVKTFTPAKWAEVKHRYQVN